MPKLSVLARAVLWNFNERFVCTSREFWQLILLVVDGNFFYAKTQFLSSLNNRGLSLFCVFKKTFIVFLRVFDLFVWLC